MKTFDELSSGNKLKMFLKKAGSSEFGAYIFKSVTGKELMKPESKINLPFGSDIAFSKTVDLWIIS